MDLESFILREVSQTEKEKYHTISFICEIYKGHLLPHLGVYVKTYIIIFSFVLFGLTRTAIALFKSYVY